MINMKIDLETTKDDMQFGNLAHFITYTNTLDRSIDYDWEYLVKGYAPNKTDTYIIQFIRKYCIHDVEFIEINNKKKVRILI